MTKLPKIYFLAGLFVLVLCNSGRPAYHEVAGIQSGIWGLNESPYVIKSDIQIPKGLVLKIEAGVVIKFAGNFQIKVEGALIANGTKVKPIVFTSLFDNEFGGKIVRSTNQNPQTFVWKGIEFSTNCDDYSSVLNHCILY